MPKYELDVTYTETWRVEVEADDQDAAELKAVSAYRTDGEHIDTEEDVELA